MSNMFICLFVFNLISLEWELVPMLELKSLVFLLKPLLTMVLWPVMEGNKSEPIDF